MIKQLRTSITVFLNEFPVYFTARVPLTLSSWTTASSTG